jgi:hypothetical protein
MESPATKSQLAAELEHTEGTIAKWINIMYRHKLIHIAEWRKHLRGVPGACWAWGPGEKDAPRPPNLGSVEWARRAREKRRLAWLAVKRRD